MVPWKPAKRAEFKGQAQGLKMPVGGSQRVLLDSCYPGRGLCCCVTQPVTRAADDLLSEGSTPAGARSRRRSSGESSPPDRLSAAERVCPVGSGTRRHLTEQAEAGHCWLV